MAFCKFSSQAVINGKTEVDNIFINDFLPFAPENAVKVYIYGLYKCSNASAYDNTLESFSKVLKISEEDILELYRYWEEQGLVQILNVVPVEIRYIPVKNVLTGAKKFKEDKYKDFNVKLQEIISGRMINPVEFSEYYSLIESLHIEPEALLMIIKYCVNLKGENVGYKYIVTVAKNWAYENIHTVSEVEERLISYEAYSDEMKQLLKAMGIKRFAYVEEKDLLLKWKNKFEFNFETIIFVAKKHKKASKSLNFEKLDEILTKYFENNLQSEVEIENFESRRQEFFDLAKDVVKTLGTYYADLSPVVDGYIREWKNLGFYNDAILMVASLCFKSSIRTLENMDAKIKKFYKLGLISKDSIKEYLNETIREDDKIKEILEKLGINRNVNLWDRNNYKTWVKDWLISEELIDYATTLAEGKAYAMEYMNKILASWHENKISNLADAKTFKLDFAFAENKKREKLNIEREYSKKDLENLFDNLEEVEIWFLI